VVALRKEIAKRDMQIKGAQGTNRTGTLYCSSYNILYIANQSFFYHHMGCTLNFIIT